MNQDINTEEVLKLMATVEGATEYLITNSEGKNDNKKAYRLRKVLVLLLKEPYIFPSSSTIIGVLPKR